MSRDRKMLDILRIILIEIANILYINLYDWEECIFALRVSLEKLLY